MLSIICDPSHIAGKKEYVEDISKEAINFNFDGLMIETHHNPKIALTDQYQQMKPEELEILLENLKAEKIAI